MTEILSIAKCLVLGNIKDKPNSNVVRILVAKEFLNREKPAFEFVTTTSALEILHKLREEQFDVVVSTSREEKLRQMEEKLRNACQQRVSSFCRAFFHGMAYPVSIDFANISDHKKGRK